MASPFRPALQLLGQYAEYHRDRRNIATHFVGVPMIEISPACGRSKSPLRCSSVDFPAPDGATIATSSPLLTVRSAASITFTCVAPSP